MGGWLGKGERREKSMVRTLSAAHSHTNCCQSLLQTIDEKIIKYLEENGKIIRE